MVCLDVSILSETTGKCNVGCHMRPYLSRLVLGNNNIQYAFHSLPPRHHLLILAVNPAQRVMAEVLVVGVRKIFPLIQVKWLS